MPKTKLLLFDIDGTLLLTGGAGRMAFERIFLELFGVQDAWKGLVPDGKTDPVIIRELAEKNLGSGLTGTDYQEICRRYTLYFEEELARAERFLVMPGVAALIPSLAANPHFCVGIATGNFERPAWLKLERAGLRPYFGFGGFGCDADHRTGLIATALARGREKAGEEIADQDVLVIGDTVHDIEAGRQLGLRTLGVATGSTSRAALEAAGADDVFADLTDEGAFIKFVTG